MVKGVPSEGWDSFFYCMGRVHPTFGSRKDAKAQRYKMLSELSALASATKMHTQLSPRRPLSKSGPAGKPPEEGGHIYGKIQE